MQRDLNRSTLKVTSSSHYTRRSHYTRLGRPAMDSSSNAQISASGANVPTPARGPVRDALWTSDCGHCACIRASMTGRDE
jgi:hypothetical protein